VSRVALPYSWPKTLLAVIHALLATIGFVNTGFDAWMFAGVLLLSVYLVGAYVWNKEKLPGWSLIAAGFLTAFSLTIVSGLIGGVMAIVVDKGANSIVLLIFAIWFVALLFTSLRGRPQRPLVWILLALIILCQLAVRLDLFDQYGLSWPVVGEWLNVSLYSAVIALLIPLGLGLCLSPRYGRIAILFVLGMVYLGFHILLDVNAKVSDQTGGTFWFSVYQAMIPFLFTVIAPFLFLRARETVGRLFGLLSPVAFAVILDLLVVGWSYDGALPRIIWLTFIPYTASILLTLVLAYLLIGQGRGHPVPD